MKFYFFIIASGTSGRGPSNRSTVNSHNRQKVQSKGSDDFKDREDPAKVSDHSAPRYFLSNFKITGVITI